METQNLYQSFNADKTIEELQYNLLQYKRTLESYIIEYSFFKYLLKSSIFKPNAINLFESLEQFKKDIMNLETATTDLITKINSNRNQITKKIE